VALKKGDDLVTKNEMSHFVEEIEMAVTYNLLLDQRLKKEFKKDKLKPVPPATTSPPKTDPRSVMTSQFLKDSVRFSKSLRSPTSTYTSSGRWLVGKWSRSDPNTIIFHLYKILKSLDFEWKGLSMFSIKARHPSRLRYKDLGRAGKEVHTLDVIKMQILLYRTLHENRDLYILDMTKLYGQTFLFLRFVNTILTYLDQTLKPAILSDLPPKEKPITFEAES